MERRVWFIATALAAVTVLILVATATPTYSSPSAEGLPKLTVESCLVQGTGTFRLRAVNWDVAGEWRLKLHLGEEVIDFGYLDAYEEVGGFDPDTAITTTVEGTWKKQFLEDGEWVDRHGAHVLSVEEHTLNGWFCPTYELGDLVWYDTDQDGIQDAGEPGVESIDVELYASPTCTGTASYSYTTAVTGTYVFAGLDAGDYCLEFHSIPTNWEITLQDQGADETLDSDVDPATARIENIDLAADDHDQDMGLFVDGSIGDRVWCDFDTNSAYDPGEGLDYVTVSLYSDDDCDGTEDSLMASVETASDGAYLFADLNTAPPGSTGEACYVSVVDLSDPDLGACTVALTPLSFALMLNADTPDVDTADFGFREDSGLPGGYRHFCPLVTNQY